MDGGYPQAGTKPGPDWEPGKRRYAELRSLAHGVPLRLNEPITVTPFLVPHRDEYSETVGITIQGRHERWYSCLISTNKIILMHAVRESKTSLRERKCRISTGLFTLTARYPAGARPIFRTRSSRRRSSSLARAAADILP